MSARGHRADRVILDEAVAMFDGDAPPSQPPLAQRELEDLADYLAEEHGAEIARLYELEQEHQRALEEIRTLRDQVHRGQVLAGDLRSRLATAEHRIEELYPAEIVKARRDAFLLGEGYLKVTSLGRQRFTTTHIPAQKVIVHDA